MEAAVDNLTMVMKTMMLETEVERAEEDVVALVAREAGIKSR